MSQVYGDNMTFEISGGMGVGACQFFERLFRAFASLIPVPSGITPVATQSGTCRARPRLSKGAYSIFS